MRNCNKCFLNTWKFSFTDSTGWVVATCKNCTNEVSFKGRRQKKIDAGIEIGTSLTVEFKTIDGKIHRKENGGWYEVDLLPDKKGMRIMRVPQTLLNN